jgi:hypothetical protein
VLLYTRQNIAVEIQQFALSSAAFQYFKTLKDLIDNNGGSRRICPRPFYRRRHGGKFCLYRPVRNNRRPPRATGHGTS